MKINTHNCIKAIRKMSDEGVPLTSQALLEAMRMEPTERSTAQELAAGWICNLRRCGLVRPVRGQKVDGPQRKLQVYELTRWGLRFKAKGKAASTGPGLRIAANPKNNDE